MKRNLIIAGGIFLIVVLLGVAGYASLNTYGKNLDAESKVWVDKVTLEIISSWDSQKAMENSSSALLEVTSQQDFETIFKELADELGSFKEYKGSNGQAVISINNGVKTITAEYIAEAEFENDSVKISIRGIKENEEWKILNFYVTPLEV